MSIAEIFPKAQYALICPETPVEVLLCIIWYLYTHTRFSSIVKLLRGLIVYMFFIVPDFEFSANSICQFRRKKVYRSSHLAKSIRIFVFRGVRMENKLIRDKYNKVNIYQAKPLIEASRNLTA